MDLMLGPCRAQFRLIVAEFNVRTQPMVQESWDLTAGFGLKHEGAQTVSQVRRLELLSLAASRESGIPYPGKDKVRSTSLKARSRQKAYGYITHKELPTNQIGAFREHRIQSLCQLRNNPNLVLNGSTQNHVKNQKSGSPRLCLGLALADLHLPRF